MTETAQPRKLDKLWAGTLAGIGTLLIASGVANVTIVSQVVGLGAGILCYWGAFQLAANAS